ncbi:basic helix-loop-helix DNA-binding superfamily protein [Prunus dulcis]|uniref:Basic helix-loop-helix DNA-binding superfamily protein n=1 Tax=Prunus dulcis TaxID=3755 RepID=A0A5H2XHZ2_PRUDU|nr:basic helix-loop-helix DNA-binding superfamily protein [Prunus dulcis]
MVFLPADDWGSLQFLNPDMNMVSFQAQQEQLAAASDILGLQDYSLPNFPDYTTCIDPLSETYESSCSENFLLPDFYLPTENINLSSFQSPEIFPSLDEYGCSYQQNPKTPKFLQPQLLAPTPSPQTQIPQQPSYECAKMNKPNGGAVTLSAQSIAARERRRRITEKTQELGRLIPGATKMNTAEMLQAAYKYVKFLQAQVSVLKLMTDSPVHQIFDKIFKQEKKDLQAVASPIVQEKLYSEEKCLVSKEFVQVLANDHDIESKPLLKDNPLDLNENHTFFFNKENVCV